MTILGDITSKNNIKNATLERPNLEADAQRNWTQIQQRASSQPISRDGQSSDVTDRIASYLSQKNERPKWQAKLDLINEGNESLQAPDEGLSC